MRRDEPSKALAFTDLANARRFAEQNADRFRHVLERRRWLIFDEQRWREDLDGAVEDAAARTGLPLAEIRATVVRGIADGIERPYAPGRAA